MMSREELAMDLLDHMLASGYEYIEAVNGMITFPAGKTEVRLLSKGALIRRIGNDIELTAEPAKELNGQNQGQAEAGQKNT